MRSLVIAVCGLVLSVGMAIAQDHITVPKSTWGNLKVKYRGTSPEQLKNDAERASQLLAQEQPSTEDLNWMESMAPEYRRELMPRLSGLARDPVRSLASTGKLVSPSAANAYWVREFIEKRSGGGAGCRPTGFWNDTGQCGGDTPPDKVYRFPCSNLANRSALRIISSSWQVNWMLGAGVDARVYADHIEVCIGYWSLYWTGTNPYSLLSNTYVYW